jgi:hypothetical protein
MLFDIVNRNEATVAAASSGGIGVTSKSHRSAFPSPTKWGRMGGGLSAISPAGHGVL